MTLGFHVENGSQGDKSKEGVGRSGRKVGRSGRKISGTLELMVVWVRVVAVDRVKSGQRTVDTTVPDYSSDHFCESNENVCVDSRNSTHLIIITLICSKVICN